MKIDYSGLPDSEAIDYTGLPDKGEGTTIPIAVSHTSTGIKPLLDNSENPQQEANLFQQSMKYSIVNDIELDNARDWNEQITKARELAGIPTTKIPNLLGVSHPKQVETGNIWEPQIKPQDPVKMIAGGFAGGVAGTVGSTLKGTGRLMQAPFEILDKLGIDTAEVRGPEDLVSQWLVEAGSTLQEGADIVSGKLNPVQFLTQSVGSLASFLVPSMALGRLGATEKGMNLLMTTAEAIGAASDAYDRKLEIAKQQGSQDPEWEANVASWIALILNEGLLYGTNRLAFFNDNLSALKSIGSETVQETGQTGIEDISVGQLSSPEAYGLSALGGAIGGGTGFSIVRLLNKQQQANKQVLDVPLDVKAHYNGVVEGLTEKGVDEKTAHRQATAAILDTQSGMEYMQKVAIATDNTIMMQALAELEQKTTPANVDAQIDKMVQGDTSIEELTVSVDNEGNIVLPEVAEPSQEAVKDISHKVIGKEEYINSITRQEMGEKIRNGDATVLDDIKSGISTGVTTRTQMQDAVRNQINEEIVNAPKGEARQAVRTQIATIEPMLNEILKADYVDVKSAEVVQVEVQKIEQSEQPEAAAEELAHAVYAEGNQDIKSFTQRMQELLGNTWQKIKDFVGRIFDRVKAFNERLGQRGIIDITPEGETRFNLQDNLRALFGLVEQGEAGFRASNEQGEFYGVGSSFPEFMKNKGWTKADVLNVWNKIQNKQALTDNQTEILTSALSQIEQSIGKANDIVVEGDEWTEAITIDKAKAFEQFYSQSEALLNQVSAETVKGKKNIAKAKLRNANIQSKLASKLKSVLPKSQIKKQVRKVSGQIKVSDLVAEDEALRAGLKKAEQAARTAFREGNKEGVAKQKAVIKEMLQRAAQKKRLLSLDEDIRRITENLAKINKSIALPFQKAITELTDGINMNLNKQKAVYYKTLQDTLDGIENPEEVGIAPETFERMKLTAQKMNRKYGEAFNEDGTLKPTLKEMTIEDKLELLDTLKRLNASGRFVRQMELQELAESRQAGREKLIADTVNLDKQTPEERKAHDSTMGEIAGEAAIEARMKTLDAYRTADMLDGFKEDGLNKQLVIESFLAARDAEYQAHIESVKLLDDLKNIEEEWTQDELNRIIYTGLIRMGANEQAQIFADKHAMTAVSLNAKEEAFLKTLSDMYKEGLADYAATFEARENEAFPVREVYYFPLLYENDFQSDIDEDFARRDISRTRQTDAGSTLARKENVKKLVRSDLLNVVLESIAHRNWYIKVQPVLDSHSSIIFHKDFRKSAGELAYNWWKDEIDKIARHGKMAGRAKAPKVMRFFRATRVNLSKAVMAYKVSSTLIQFMSVFNGMAYAASQGMVKPVLKMPIELIKAFTKVGDTAIVQMSKELTLRDTGEFAYHELVNQQQNKFTKAGYHFMKRFDLKTAAAVQQAFYDALQGKTKDPLVLAELYTSLSQGSTNTALMPQILASGELAKTALTFQTFNLYTWNMLSHDFIHRGLIKGTAKQKFYGALALSLMAIAQALTDDLQELIWETTTGKDTPESRGKIRELIALIPSYMPVIGMTLQKYIETGEYKSPEPPIARMAGDAIQGIGKIFSADEWEGKLQGALKAMETGIATIYGIPGTSQIFDMLERFLPKTTAQMERQRQKDMEQEEMALYGKDYVEQQKEAKKEDRKQRQQQKKEQLRLEGY